MPSFLVIIFSKSLHVSMQLSWKTLLRFCVLGRFQHNSHQVITCSSFLFLDENCMGGDPTVHMLMAHLSNPPFVGHK